MRFLGFIYRILALTGFLSTVLVVGYIALPYKSERVEAAIAKAKESAETLREQVFPGRFESPNTNLPEDEGISPEWNSSLPSFSPTAPRERSRPQFDLGKQPAPDPDQPAILPLPEHGLSHVVHSRPTPNQLEIINDSPVLHSLVKLEDADTGKVLSKHFIRSGETLSIDAPDGVIRAKVASGRDWLGEPYLFGDETIFYDMSGPITLNNQEGFYYLSYEINVITHQQLIKRPLKREEW